MNRIVTIVLVTALAALAASAGTAVARSSTDVTVDVAEDGDADWAVTTTIPVESDDERRALERIRQNPDERDALADRVAGSFRAFADRASGRVDREMSIDDVAAAVDVEGDSADVTVTFAWTGFAATSDGAVSVDELFDGGLSLSGDETMTVTGPDGYGLADESSIGAGSVDGNAVTWRGPVDVSGDVDLRWSAEAGGGGEGMPGFAPVAAIPAIVLAVAYRRR